MRSATLAGRLRVTGGDLYEVLFEATLEPGGRRWGPVGFGGEKRGDLASGKITVFAYFVFFFWWGII